MRLFYYDIWLRMSDQRVCHISVAFMLIYLYKHGKLRFTKNLA